MSDNPIFSYTHRSYEDARQEGISKIPIISKGAWTDTNSSDPGIIIIDYIHALVDMLQYYQDHQALESYITTAKERKNIFMLAHQLGYDINCAKGSMVEVKFSLPKEHESGIYIPSNTVVTTSEAPRIPFYTLEDTYVNPGMTSVTIPCKQGLSASYTYTGTGISSLTPGYQVEDQYVILPNLGIDLDTISITDNYFTYWKKVNNTTFEDAGTKCYSVHLLPDGNVKVQFGNDERGYTPKETDILYIDYIYNLGSKGKVGANTITLLSKKEHITDEDGNVITNFIITNPEESTGGTDPEDSETIVSLAPSIIKTQDRAVTLDDYEAIARKIPGVKDAKAYDIKTSPDDCLYYEVKVLIIPEDGVSNDILNTEVYNILSRKSIPPVIISIISPTYKEINLDITVVIDNNYLEESVEYQIRQTLISYFESLSGIMNAEIIPNILVSYISNVKGVSYVEEITPNTAIKLGAKELPVLGKVNLTIKRRS